MFGLVIKCVFAGSFVGPEEEEKLSITNNIIFLLSRESDLLVWIQLLRGCQEQSREN